MKLPAWARSTFLIRTLYLIPLLAVWGVAWAMTLPDGNNGSGDGGYNSLWSIVQLDATYNCGYFGLNNSANTMSAVYATTAGSGNAVQGVNTNAMGYGGYFETTNTSGTGDALFAESFGGTSSKAVEGTAKGKGYAAYFSNNPDPDYHTSTPVLYVDTGTPSTSGGLAAEFQGDVHVFGNLTKTSGSFLIDHPLDPANKFLYHSFVESPDMKNVYDGVVTTDASGAATVTMPTYFQALNSDFRYQLTPIGQFSQAIVATEIQNNQFTIKTDKPNVKVSWQVTGIRQDPWANSHRIVPEVDKSAAERGKYVDPIDYGQPATAGIGYHAPG